MAELVEQPFDVWDTQTDKIQAFLISHETKIVQGRVDGLRDKQIAYLRKHHTTSAQT